MADELAAITAFTDLTFALFPIAIVFRLQMKLKHKLGLASLLGLGILYTSFACSFVFC